MEKVENKRKILIVDDNNDLTTVLVDKFNLSGFEAQGAFDGEEGLEKALEFHPDIILLDLLMPKVSGIEMLKQLRKDSWGKEAKVVILTLLDNTGFVAKAMESNIYGYIVKTDYTLDQIVKKIKDTLDGIK
ncbi:MAG: response regulator [Minisyncoccia bacterium]